MNVYPLLAAAFLGLAFFFVLVMLQPSLGWLFVVLFGSAGVYALVKGGSQ